MTASLPARVAALRDKLARLETLSSKAAEASELSGLRADLSEPVQVLTALTKRHALFQSLGVPTNTPESLGRLSGRAEAIRDRFRADRKSVALKKGQLWRAMLTEAATASADLDTSLTTAWRGYRSVLFAGEPPGKIAGSLAGTPSNNEALNAYRLTYDAFARMFQSVPADATVVERSKALAAELVRIAERFDFDVKPEVKKFLAAVQAGGAPLSLLTPDVLDWMKKGNGMDSYRIRAADTP